MTAIGLVRVPEIIIHRSVRRISLEHYHLREYLGEVFGRLKVLPAE